MKYHPQTRRLFTDDGRLIKRLQCSRNPSWKAMGPGDRPEARRCALCNLDVLDTAKFSDAELLAIVEAQPSTCLAISANQDNITLTTSA